MKCEENVCEIQSNVFKHAQSFATCKLLLGFIHSAPGAET